jgi:hypothetical protein
MKRIFAFPLAGAVVLFGTLTGLFQLSQAQSAQQITYRAATFVKIAPEKEAAALEFARGAGVKLTQEAVNSGRMASFSLWRTAFAGVGTDYNYIQVIEYNGPPPADLSPEARDQMYRKATGMSFQEYQQKLLSFGTPVGSTLSRIEAAVPGPAPAIGSYVQVIRWKITPQRGADYANYIQKKLQPLNALGAKEGRYLSWSASRSIFPGGNEAPYDATTSFIYKDLASILPATPGSADQAQVAFAKVFPGQNYSGYIDEGRQLRQTVRTELWRLVAATGPASR